MAGYDAGIMDLPHDELMINGYKVIGLHNPARENQYEIYTKTQSPKICPVAAGDDQEDALLDFEMWLEEQLRGWDEFDDEPDDENDDDDFDDELDWWENE